MAQPASTIPSLPGGIATAIKVGMMYNTLKCPASHSKSHVDPPKCWQLSDIRSRRSIHTDREGPSVSQLLRASSQSLPVPLAVSLTNGPVGGGGGERAKSFEEAPVLSAWGSHCGGLQNAASDKRACPNEMIFAYMT